MCRTRHLILPLVVGSLLAWGEASWAQQDREKTPPEDQGQAEGRSGQDPEPSSSHVLRGPNAPLRVQQYLEQLDRFNEQRLNAEMGLPFGNPNARDGWFVAVLGNDELGAILEPADESIRAQLGLSADQGLTVKAVSPGGAAFHIGLKPHDILLSLAGKPLANVGALTSQLKAAGETEVPLEILRAGKRITIPVKPRFHVTFGQSEPERPRYQLGIQIAPIDETLRAQLEIPDRQGVLVTKVESGSAAEKAGFKPFDVLLSVGGRALKDSEELVLEIQKSAGKPLECKILRAGKTVSIQAAPDERRETTENSADRFLMPRFRAVRPWKPLPPSMGLSFPLPSERQMGDLRNEVRELRQAIEQLQRSMQPKPAESDRSAK